MGPVLGRGLTGAVRGQGWPIVGRGQSVGLLGGSFDPAHAGHAHITREALKRFGLDWVWWLVTPGNPLKAEGPAPLERRLAVARAVMDHPRVKVTALERRMGTRYTAATLAGLQRRYPGVRFVWLMGADNLAGFHEWDNWQGIMETVSIGVMARPGQRISARTSVAADVYGFARLGGAASQRLPALAPPRWCFVNVPMRAESSSMIRAGGGWVR